MRKIIAVFIIMMMVAVSVMAESHVKPVYDGGNHGVFVYVDSESYGKTCEDLKPLYGMLKLHNNYFVWNINKKQFELGTAKGFDLWLNTFGKYFKYMDEYINDGYGAASLVFATDGFENDQIKATITVLSTGYVYGFWDYSY